MKKHLIPIEGNFYKANLHTHSTVSDGSLTPEELKKAYKDLGYSVLAYTDHDVMVPHMDLRDPDFLPLIAIEYAVNREGEGPLTEGSTCHFSFIALDENMDTQILWHREKYVPPKSQHSIPLVKFDESLPNYERSYTPECICEMMRAGREANFFVIYNHPAWSQESYNQYINYDGMHAMEIINNISNVGTGIFEYNDHIYDDMLRAGKHIYCVAADDAHAKYPPGSPRCDIGGSYIQIKAERLDYPSIAEALKNGHFYSSEGPSIEALWYEDGKICIDTSPADKIVLTSYPKRGNSEKDLDGKDITHAEFELNDRHTFVRITVIDKAGRRAYTNAYFTDELRKS